MAGAHRAPRKTSLFIRTARRARKPFAAVAALSVVMLGIIPMAQASAQDGTPPAPKINSEYPDYAAGSTVRLLGSDWAAGENVHIEVNDTLGQTWQDRKSTR